MKKCDDDIIITFFQVFLVFGVVGSVKQICSVGTCWMQHQILHPTSSLDQNLSKNTRRYVENTNKKISFFMIPIPKFILKFCLRGAPFFNFKSFDWLIHDDMEFVVFLEVPF